MRAIADTDRLVADRVITPDQARVIEGRAREAMVGLGINALLCLGIIAATAGLIFWLANAMAVAICGTLALVAGAVTLARGGELFRMFGNAAALIGAGMLIGGAAAELLAKYETIAGWSMAAAGAVITLIAGRLIAFPGLRTRFVVGSILLMGLAMHTAGLVVLLGQYQISGALVSLFYLYVAVITAAAGGLTDFRLVTAFAIVPFAQALDTGTAYFFAAYVFFSPEPTLSIIQMGLLIGLCLWLAKRAEERIARHARVLVVLAFVVANLCALVGSLWGDEIGETVWGRTALALSAELYAMIWAVALAGMVLWAAHRNQRGLFNAAITFGAIHAYTQFFQSFADEPLAYVIGGLTAIPLAWGMWRLNRWIAGRSTHNR